MLGATGMTSAKSAVHQSRCVRPKCAAYLPHGPPYCRHRHDICV